MSLFDRFKKGAKAETAYFDQRKGDVRDADGQAEILPSYLAQSGKKLDKGLFIDLLRTMKTHDLKASVGVFSNTTDNFKKEAGLVINKGIVPKKIVAYLHEMRLNHIEKALSHVKAIEPDTDGFYSIDDKLAGNLNLPADVVIYPIFSSSKIEMGVILVARCAIGDRKKLVGKIKKTIK